MKKRLSALIALCLIFCLAGCESESENKQADLGQKFLQKALTLPIPELKELEDQAVKNGAPYTDEEFFGAVTQCFSEFVEEEQCKTATSRLHSSVINLHHESLMRKKALAPKSIVLSPLEGENLYSLEAVLTLEKEGEAPREITFSGSLQFNEKGMIDYVEFKGEGFQEFLKA